MTGGESLDAKILRLPEGRTGTRRLAVDYRPAPRDTSTVEVPPEITGLTELLAQNARENWSASGWKTAGVGASPR